MHEHAADLSVRVKFADKDRQTLGGGVELALVEQGSADIGADVENLVLHRSLTGGHEIEAAQVGGAHDDGSCNQDRNGQLAAAEACRSHHHELAVRI